MAVSKLCRLPPPPPSSGLLLLLLILLSRGLQRQCSTRLRHHTARLPPACQIWQAPQECRQLPDCACSSARQALPACAREARWAGQRWLWQPSRRGLTHPPTACWSLALFSVSCVRLIAASAAVSLDWLLAMARARLQQLTRRDQRVRAVKGDFHMTEGRICLPSASLLSAFGGNAGFLFAPSMTCCL